jgi:hypothetical protein
MIIRQHTKCSFVSVGRNSQVSQYMEAVQIGVKRTLLLSFC